MEKMRPPFHTTDDRLGADASTIMVLPPTGNNPFVLPAVGSQDVANGGASSLPGTNYSRGPDEPDTYQAPTKGGNFLRRHGKG